MKISIITAAYNSGATIACAINSLWEQSHRNIEYLVIDGQSTDNTSDIVKSYGNQISKFISEPDKGIYDAMNKGVRLASGDIVGILNSDDMYANNSVLTNVSIVFEDPSVDICYGDLVYVANNDINEIVRVWKSAPYKQGMFLEGWVPPHPTFFVRRSVYEKHGLFDLSFPLAADFELMLRFLHCLKLKSHYIPDMLVKMRLGGATNNSLFNIFRQNLEIYRACRINGVSLGARWIIGKSYDRFNQYLRAYKICG